MLDTNTDKNHENNGDKNNSPNKSSFLRRLGFSNEVVVEINSVIELASPIIATSSLSFIMGFVGIAMVGHLGKVELAAASLAATWFNALFFPLEGAATALDTLFSQCYGAGSYVMYGDWLITGLFLSIFLAIPGIVLMLYTSYFMSWLGQDEELSILAEQYCTYLSIGHFPFIAFLVFQKYFQAQNILAPLVWIGVFANILNICLSYLFVYHTPLRLIGAAIGFSISQWVQLLLAILYSFKHISKEPTWPKLSSKPFQFSRIFEFMKYGVFGAIMVAEEAWAFEVSTIFAGILGTVALDTHTCVLALVQLMYNILPFPISIAGSIRIGHLLGAGDSVGAKRSALTLLIMTILAVSLSAIVTLVASDRIGLLFTDDEEVLERVSEIILIVAFIQLFDGIQSCGTGIFRGVGRHHTVALLNFFSFWVFGLGFGAFLAFYLEFGLIGIWWGTVSGVFLTSFLLFYMIYKINWVHEAEEAIKRAAKEEMLSHLLLMNEPINPHKSKVVE
eukprot:c21495_g2_i1.p1 GENE.c21495_g2_i1~~c21495_g2_i1.p1  ORF type:complete len:505 (-),score=170.36 c21495_g2_i1:35-1549(-)